MTEWAIPFWIFITLFLILPLAFVVWMTIERRRERRPWKEERRRGFEVKLNTGESPVPRKRRGNA
jgi:hypothetical protein